MTAIPPSQGAAAHPSQDAAPLSSQGASPPASQSAAAPPPQDEVILPSQRAIDNCNFWETYRNANPQLLNAQQLSDQLKINYVAPPDPPPPAVPQFAGWGAVAPPPDPAAPTPAENVLREAFLKSQPAELDTWQEAAQVANWRGTKLLGSGSGGLVGLWEYTARRIAGRPIHKEVAVKESSRKPLQDIDMEVEATKLEALVTVGTEHVTKLLVAPVHRNAGGFVERLILEYCPMGDLFSVRRRFVTRRRPIAEISLWRMFDCLVDAIGVLEHGAEPTLDDEDNAVVQANPGWKDKIHFDIKHTNILVKARRGKHREAPLCMFTDFGLTLNRKQNWTKSEKAQLRRRGTHRFFAPEQFTARWDYLNWNAGGVAGEYGTKTNVWGIGCIIYGLIALDQIAPDQKQPFLPTWPLYAEPAKGITYGHKLNSFQPDLYSRKLTDLVQQCLYDVPAHRPNVLQLKELIASGLEDARGAGAVREDWENFLPDPPPGTRRRKHPAHRCYGRDKNRSKTRCKNMIVFGGGPYCHIHRS
ncbi:kinase-like protein [Stipitochalara longipes BDJ]|nr:kinase-like protein [Stipitochalara longipes BDJ]